MTKVRVKSIIFFSANPVGDACIDDYDGDKVPDVDDECPHVKHISKTNFRDYFTIDLFPGHPEPSPEWRVAKMVTIFKLMSVLLLRFRQRQACIIRSYLILCTFSALFRNFFFFLHSYFPPMLFWTHFLCNLLKDVLCLCRFYSVKASLSGHLRDAKMVSVTRAGRLREISAKIQSLYGSREKRGFVKMSVSRAGRLWESVLLTFCPGSRTCQELTVSYAELAYWSSH